MDMDTEVNGLAHELWAMSQNSIAIEDAVMPIMAELIKFAAHVKRAEREACAKVCKTKSATYAAYEGEELRLDYIDGMADGAEECADAIRARSDKER